MAYFTVTDEANEHYSLVAISEQTGEQQWRYALLNTNAPHLLSAPVVVGSRVFFQDYLQETVYAIDATSGLELFQINQPSAMEFVADDNGVFINTFSGATRAFSLDNGSQLWENFDGERNGLNPATARDGNLFATRASAANEQNSQAFIYQLRQSDGTQLARIADNLGMNEQATGFFPIATDNGLLMVPKSSFGDFVYLTVFDIASQAPLWPSTAPNNPPIYDYQPAYADGRLYACWTDGCDIIDVNTGNVVNTFNLMVRSEPAVSNGLLFLNTAEKVVALDINTGAERWSYRGSGKITLSANGILYIAFNDGVIAAINLQ